MRSISAVLIGAVMSGGIGSSWADGAPMKDAVVPGPAKVDATFPQKKGNYFRISQEGKDKIIVIAVIPTAGGETKAVQGFLTEPSPLTGEMVSFGDCGLLRLGNINETANPLSPSARTVAVLDGQLEGVCGIYPTPRFLQKMPD